MEELEDEAEPLSVSAAGRLSFRTVGSALEAEESEWNNCPSLSSSCSPTDRRRGVGAAGRWTVAAIAGTINGKQRS